MQHKSILFVIQKINQIEKILMNTTQYKFYLLYKNQLKLKQLNINSISYYKNH